MNPGGFLGRVLGRVRGLFRSHEDLDLTSGAIAMPLFYLSLPIVVTNVLQVGYNLADTFWLGQHGTVSLAAITFAFPLVFLLIALGMGVSVAGSVLVAQHTGAGQPERATFAASQTVTFALVTSTVLGALGYLILGEVLALIGASGGVLTRATEYMEVIALGLPLMFGFFVFVALMRGGGDTITPMVVMLGTVLLNVALDPFLIFGWGPFPAMGVEGAAVATVVTRGLAFLVGTALLLSGTRRVRIAIGELRPRLRYARTIFGIAIPASLEVTSRAISVNLLLVIVALFSVSVEAAFGVGIRVFSLIFMPAIALDRGVETMTGQNVGAGKSDRAARTNHLAAAAAFAILATLGVIIFATAPWIVGIFTTDPAVVREGADFLRWVAPTFGFIGVVRAYLGGFRGAGRVLTAASISIVMVGVVRLPLAWVGAQRMGPDGIWLAFAVSNVLAAALAVGWFRRGTWRDVDLTDDAVGPPTALSED